MPSPKKNFRFLILSAIGFWTVVAFQNCGKFQSALLETPVSGKLGVDAQAPPPPAGPPVPLDFKSDIFTRLGLKLGDKGNSTCELTPPVIPEFNLPTDDSHVFKVCAESTCAYHQIADALTAAPAGSVIAIQAGLYHECLRIEKSDITLQGRGGRPHIQHENCPPAPYAGAVIGVNADRARIENLELSDTTANTLVAISSSRVSGDLTLSNLYIHDAAGGLYTLTAGRVEITHSFFSHLGHMNGTDPHTSPAINVNGGSQAAVITNTVVVRAKQGGAMFALGADTNQVNCVIAADLDDGLSEFPMKFGLGMNSTLTNSVLQKGPQSIPQMLLFWERNTPKPADQFTANNILFISDRPTRDRDMLEFWATVPSQISNLTFIGPNSASFSQFPNSQAFDSRALAGIASDVIPYPGAALTPKP